MVQYKIIKVEEGKMIEMSYAEMEREVLNNKLSGLLHDIDLVREQLDQIAQEYAGEMGNPR